jgi:hypothetical protein
MSERKPIFLFIAIGVPILEGMAFGAILLTEALEKNSSTQGGGYIGDNNLAAGVAVPFYTLVGTILFGLLFVSISIFRKEKFHALAKICLSLYLFPLGLGILLYAANLWRMTHPSPAARITIDASK